MDSAIAAAHSWLLPRLLAPIVVGPYQAVRIRTSALPESRPSRIPAGSMKIMRASVTPQLMTDSARPYMRSLIRPIAPATRSAANTPLIAIIR